jgi:hypothetical protein
MPRETQCAGRFAGIKVAGRTYLETKKSRFAEGAQLYLLGLMHGHFDIQNQFEIQNQNDDAGDYAGHVVDRCHQCSPRDRTRMVADRQVGVPAQFAHKIQRFLIVRDISAACSALLPAIFGAVFSRHWKPRRRHSRTSSEHPSTVARHATSTTKSGRIDAFFLSAEIKKAAVLRLLSDGGRTRARTWDPMIKSQRYGKIFQRLFRLVLVSSNIEIAVEFSLVGIQGRRERVIGSNRTVGGMSWESATAFPHTTQIYDISSDHPPKPETCRMVGSNR